MITLINNKIQVFNNQQINYFNYNYIYSVLSKTDKTQKTIKEYSSRVYKSFNEFLKTNTFNKFSFLEFKKYLEDKINSNDPNIKLSVSTCNHYLTSVRSFLKGLYALEILPTDITKDIKGFKQIDKHKKDMLSYNDVEKILNYLKSSDSKDSLRNLIMFLLLINNGLRLKELTNIQYEDINFADCCLKILGKCRLEKEIIYVSTELIALLKDYCQKENFKCKDYIFYSRHHKFNKSQYKVHLTTTMINGIFTKIFIILGIKSKTKTVHSARHFYFTTLIRKSKLKITEIMKLGRLQTVNTILHYSHDINNKLLWEKAHKVLNYY